MEAFESQQLNAENRTDAVQAGILSGPQRALEVKHQSAYSIRQSATGNSWIVDSVTEERIALFKHLEDAQRFVNAANSTDDDYLPMPPLRSYPIRVKLVKGKKQ